MSPRPPGPPAFDPLLWGRRALGLLLLVPILLPLHRVLDTPQAGFAGAQAVSAGDWYYVGTWKGTALVLLAATAPAFLLRGGELDRWLDRAGRLLLRPSTAVFAAGAAALAALATALFVLLVTQGKPLLTDAVAQLVQGRYVAAGALAGPHLERPEFWGFQFMLNTPEGWVSQYPPLHSLLLGAGFAAGAVWLVGPALMAVTAAFAVPVAERLLPDDDRAVARLGALLVGLSPLLVGLAGGYMNHAAATALAVPAAYFALRARDGSPWWAVAAGAAAGAMVAARPLSGLVVGATVTVGTWLLPPGRGAGPGRAGDGGAEGRRGRGRRWWRRGRGDAGGGRSGRRVIPISKRAGSGASGSTATGRPPPGLLSRLGLAAVGALPFGIALSLYNGHFFGSPFRFGYIAGTGPRHGLGFHLDPWGHLYGPLEAVGYTAADLLALARDLLGTPLPVVAVVALFLLLGRRLEPGVRLLVAWALLPVLAHAFYWHHDLVLGPRMLGEAAPAWALLAAVGGVRLVRLVAPDDRGRGGFSPRAGLAGAFLLALAAGLLWLGPGRLARLESRVAGDPVWGERKRPAPGQAERAALVFVHEGWPDRLGALLVARGMRLDSVRTLVTRYRPCPIQAALEGRPGKEMEEECRRQAASDRLGALSLPSYLWRGDLPGIPDAEPMWVRDLGPERNADLIERFPDREPWMLVPPPEGRRPRAVPYDEGVELLWRPPPAGRTSGASSSSPPGAAPAPSPRSP